MYLILYFYGGGYITSCFPKLPGGPRVMKNLPASIKHIKKVMALQGIYINFDSLGINPMYINSLVATYIVSQGKFIYIASFIHKAIQSALA